MAKQQPDLSSYIQTSGQRWNVDPALAAAVVQQESSGNPGAMNMEGGGKGAYGAMQVRQAALADYNKANGTKYTMDDLLKPQIGVDVGTWYLGQQLDQFGDPTKALIAYKQGAASPDVVKGTHPYAGQVLSRMGAPAPAKSATLPGIPTAPQASAQDDDSILAAFSKGAAPAGQKAAGGVQSDDAILSAFTKAAAPEAPVTKPAAAQAAAAPSSEAPNKLESLGAGLGHGFGSIVLGGQQLLGKGLEALGANSAGQWLVNDANAGLRKIGGEFDPYQQANPMTATAGDIGGSIVATAPLAAAAPVARTMAGAAGIGAGLGAANAALTPVSPDSQNFGLDKLKQIGAGAAVGGAISPLARMVGNVISPNVSDDVRTLMDKGVTPTPGQILGGGAARTESKLSSVPVLGDMIKNAQQRAVNDFNRAAYNEALSPIGKTFSGEVGQSGIEKVGQEIGKVYDDVLPKMQLRVDPQFQADVTKLGQMAQGLPESQQNTFMNILRTQIFGKLGPQNTMDGIDLKGVQSELARTAKGYLGDQSFDNRQLGAAVSALRDAVDSNLARVNPPELAQKLSNANQAWANFVRLRTAASSTGAMNNEGIFTAAQLQNAVRSADKSVGKGATATGNALMQDLSGAGQRVLGSKYPDSGTVGRGLMALLAPGSIGAGLVSAPVPTLAILGGIGAGSLPYTQTGQRLAAALLTQRPQFAQPVGNAVRNYGTLLAPGIAPALLPGRE